MRMSVACPCEPPDGLVNEDARIGQSETFAFGAGSQQQRSHRSTLADADRRHVRANELHRVVDRHARRDRTTRRVDVDVDVFFRIFGFEEEKLGDDQVGDLIVDRACRGK